MASQVIEGKSTTSNDVQSRGPWVVLLCFVAAAVSQWPPLVTEGYVRTDIFVLTVIIASAPVSAAWAGAAGALVGSSLILLVPGLHRGSPLDSLLALIFAVGIGLLYRYLTQHVLWRRAWVGFLALTAVVLVLIFAPTSIGLRLSGQHVSPVSTAQQSLPALIAVLLAGVWTFAGHSRRTGMQSTRGWPVALAVVAAMFIAGQGVIASWVATENASLDAASRSVSDALTNVFVNDQNSYKTVYSAAPRLPWTDQERFGASVGPVLLLSPALVASGLLEQQSGNFDMKYAVDRQGLPAPALADELGGSPADASLMTNVTEHPKLLGMRTGVHDGSSEVTAEYAVLQTVAAGSPAQILTVAESLPKALSQAADNSLGTQQDTVHLTLTVKTSPDLAPGVVVADRGTASATPDLGVSPMSTPVPLGNNELILTAAPGDGFGIDGGVRRITWLGLLFLAGSTLLLYFRGLMASDAIEESEHRYRLLAENSADVVLQHSGPEQIVTWVSPSLRGVLGWEPTALIGKPLRDFVHPDDHVNGADLIAAAHKYQDVAASGEIRFATADADWRWMSAATKTVASRKSIAAAEAGIVSLRDIQDSVDSRKALEKSESLFRTSME